MTGRILCLSLVVSVAGIGWAEKPPADLPGTDVPGVYWAQSPADPVVGARGESRVIDLGWTGAPPAVTEKRGALPTMVVAGGARIEVVEGASGTIPIAAGPKIAENGLDILGSVSYLVSGGVLQFWADEIRNSRMSGTSGSLRLQLWATATYPVHGNPITGHVLGGINLSPLQAGFSYTNVYSGNLTFSAPPVGCWWITMILLEYLPPWTYQDLRTFPAQEDFGTGACGSSCSDDSWEEDDDCMSGNQITLGSTQTHRLCDEDWIWIDAVQGQTYTFETSNLIGGADTVIQLYDDCGSMLASDDDGGSGVASKIVWTASSTGYLDLRITEYNNDYQDGKGYDVRVTGGGGGGGSGSCISNATTLYLQNGRFKVTGQAYLGGNPVGFFLQNICPYDVPSQTAAAFYFNTALPPVQEGFISIRDECGRSRDSWIVEVASASTRKFWLDVTDTWNSITHRYENPVGGSVTFFGADAVSFRNSCP
jgi:hypothetical protein